MASIRKRTWRTSGKPRTAWQVDYRDRFNRRRSKQFTSLEEARAWLETTNLHSTSASPNGKTVADATRAWVDRAESDELERSTIVYYRRAKELADPYIGSIALTKLTKQDVMDFRKALARDKTTATATRTLHVLKMALNQAVDDGWAERNVARRLRSAKSSRHRKAAKKKINVPTRADLRAMVEVLETRVQTLREQRRKAASEPDAKKAKRMRNERSMAERQRPMFLTLFEAGLRPSELRGLAWDEVKFDRGGIEVLQRVDQWQVMGDCKTEAAYRFIPLSKQLMAILAEWEQLCPASEFNLVFPTAGGLPISARNLDREFERLQFAASLTRIVAGPGGKQRRRRKYTPKDCRHGAASWWIHKRINLKDLTTRIGHSSIQVTFDVYGHIIEEVESSGTLSSDLDDDLYS